MILGKWTQGLGRLSDLSNVTEAPKVVFISDNSQYVTQWKGVLCSKFIYKALSDLCNNSYYERDFAKYVFVTMKKCDHTKNRNASS